MVEITYQMVLSTIQTLSLVVGVIYYITIMRNSQKTRELTLESQELARKAQEQTLETRQNQIFMQIYQQVNSEDTQKSWADLMNLEIKDYDDYLQKYDSSVNPSHFGKRAHLWYSFNTIGELLRQGIIEPDLLRRLNMGLWTIPMWEKWRDIIKEIRVKENIPDAWEGFEYLYDEMKKIRDIKEYPKITYPQQN